MAYKIKSEKKKVNFKVNVYSRTETRNFNKYKYANRYKNLVQHYYPEDKVELEKVKNKK